MQFIHLMHLLKTPSRAFSRRKPVGQQTLWFLGKSIVKSHWVLFVDLGNVCFLQNHKIKSKKKSFASSKIIIKNQSKSYGIFADLGIDGFLLETNTLQ